MSVNEIVEMINKASEENRKKMNEQIDKFKTELQKLSQLYF